MKKTLIKLLIPLTALLVSSCQLIPSSKGGGRTIPTTGGDSTGDTSGGTSNPTSGGDTSTTTGGTATGGTSGASGTSSTSSTSVTPTDVYPTSISIPSSKTLNVGQSTTLSVTFIPSNTTVKSVNWTTSKSAVATVDNGTVTAVSGGTAVITAIARNANNEYITSTCSVTVNDSGSISKTHLSYTYDDYMENNYYTLDNCPLSGSPKLLIIPVWFSDSDTFIATSNKETVRSDIEKVYLGTNSETGWRSVKTFYEEESQSAMTLTGVVTDWYNTGVSYKTYANASSGMNATTSLVTTASNAYFSKAGSDPRSSFDTNNDGYLDGVMLIYAAPDMQSLGNESYGNLWAYCYWVQQAASVGNPRPNVFFWASYDFMYSESKAQTQTGMSSYGHGDTSHCNLDAHTFIHEMGHVLGLEDYYDYSDNGYEAAGGFSMQDMNVGGHDPYSVMAYGWADPYIPTKSMSITINPFQSSHDLILLANHTVNSIFDEYILLELYTPTGLNQFDSTYAYRGAYPSGSSVPGIRLWHIDARLVSYSTSDWSNNPNDGNVVHAMTNTYDNENGNGHVSPLGEDYYNYNILQLIRNDETESYCTDSWLSSSSLFRQGSSFTQSTYKSQFVDGTSMNNGSALGWSFSVTSLSSSSATIQVTKL